MLTDRKAREAKPGPKPVKLTDGEGLHLVVTPAGGKLWRYRYEVRVGEARKEKLLSLGRYPGMGVGEARKARDAARALLDQGKDPSTEKKVARTVAAQDAANTLRPIAERWYAMQEGRWSHAYRVDVRRNLDVDLLPALGHLPIRDINERMVLEVIRRIEARAIHTARRARMQLGAVFVFAIAEGIADRDPSSVIRGAMKPTPAVVSYPAITDLEELRQLLRDVDAIPAYPGTRLALRLVALTAVRSKEARGATAAEFEGLDGPEPFWNIPAERMKGRRDKRRPHKVPLSPEAVEVVRAAMAFSRGSPFLFPSILSARSPMSETAMWSLVDRAGYGGRHCPHGFRAAFVTIMAHRHREDQAILDLMLAHVPGNATESAYNRAAHMTRRRELACEWAALLSEGLASPHSIILLPRVRVGQGPHQPGRRPIPKKPYGPRDRPVQEPIEAD